MEKEGEVVEKKLVRSRGEEGRNENGNGMTEGTRWLRRMRRKVKVRVVMRRR